MPKSNIITRIAKREELSSSQADFLEELILRVREDCEKVNSGGVEYVISKVLDEFVDERGE